MWTYALAIQTFEASEKSPARFELSGRSLLVTSYDSLTMAAQFSDVVLPQPHEQDLRVELPDGSYCCRVVQMFDPQVDEHAKGQSADFVLVLSEPPGPLPEWSEIPWHTNA